jgi:hypothetical protein
MTELIIDNELAEQLRRLAQAENRPIDAVLRSALGSYTAANELRSIGQLDQPQAAVYEVWSPQVSPEAGRELLKVLQDDSAIAPPFGAGLHLVVFKHNDS